MPITRKHRDEELDDNGDDGNGQHAYTAFVYKWLRREPSITVGLLRRRPTCLKLTRSRSALIADETSAVPVKAGQMRVKSAPTCCGTEGR